MRLAAIALIILPTLAEAQSVCRVYEYAEMRDWSAEVLRERYCDYYRAMHRSLDIALLEGRAGRSGAANRATNDSSRCSQEMDRMKNILESKYRESRPTCPAPDSPK